MAVGLVLLGVRTLGVLGPKGKRDVSCPGKWTLVVNSWVVGNSVGNQGPAGDPLVGSSTICSPKTLV